MTITGSINLSIYSIEERKMKSKMSLFAIMFLLTFLCLTGCSSSSSSNNPDATLQTASADYPNASLLVSADSAEESLHAPQMVVIDARPQAAYAQGHIPGAVNLVHNDFWTGGTGLKPVAELETLLGEAGLSRDMTYVIYDDTTASWGAAGRIFWMLEYLGCEDAHILDGGWDKWSADGKPIDTAANTLPSATFTAEVNTHRTASKEYILRRLNDPDFVVIDARTDEEYIGWQLYGEARGGHIPGAVNVPYAWYFYPDKTTLRYEDLKEMFEARGITSDKEVTAHCAVGIRSGYTYFLLRLMGYARCSNYDASIVDWSADEAYPMDKLENYEKLVHPSWVKGLIDGNDVPNPPAEKYVIVATTGLANPNQFIPGSIWIQGEEWELRGAIGGTAYGSGNLWPAATLQANIEDWGIDKDTTVIVYFATPGSADLSITARLWWMLMYAGVEDVRIMNGGIDAWIACGYEVDAAAAERSPVDDFFNGEIGAFPLHQEYLATTEDIEDIVDDPAGHPNDILCDIRSMVEYIGGPNDYLSIGIPLTEVGRIPGAKWGHWGPKTLVGGDFWDKYDGTLRSYPEVAQMWEDYGIIPADDGGSPNTLIHYCGTGWRSSLAFYYCYLMGWNTKNYDGSFLEWSVTHPNAALHVLETGWPY